MISAVTAIGGGLFGFALAWATWKDGIATGRRGFELGLENRASIAAFRTEVKDALADNRLETEKIFHRVTTAFGKSINGAMKPILDAQEQTAQAVAVLVEAQQRAERASNERIERIEVELRDWQIRERTKP